MASRVRQDRSTGRGGKRETDVRIYKIIRILAPSCYNKSKRCSLCVIFYPQITQIFLNYLYAAIAAEVDQGSRSFHRLLYRLFLICVHLRNLRINILFTF